MEPLTVARRALQLVLVIALVGVAFSGVLTYLELTAPAPTECGALGPGGLLGMPTCLYGLIMYSLIAIVAAYPLVSARESDRS